MENLVEHLVCLPITSLFNPSFIDASFGHWVTFLVPWPTPYFTWVYQGA